MASAPPSELVARLREHGQEHLVRFWDRLDDAGRRRLTAELEGLDLALLDHLVETLVRGDGDGDGAALALASLEPGEVVRLEGAEAQRDAAVAVGAAALAAGEVAVVVV